MSPLDWLSPAKIKEALEYVHTQITRLIDSKLLRHGGLPEAEVADYVGQTVNTVADLARPVSHDAVDGVASMARHGEGGIGTVDETIANIPEPVRPESTSSIEAAARGSHSDELLETPGSPNHDPHGTRRTDEAHAASLVPPHPHLREYVTPYVGEGLPFKSMQEFEAARFMRAGNLKSNQVEAMISIRNAIPNPTTGTKMQKVIKGTDIDSFINSNSNISGFVAKTDDAGTAVFNNSDDMIEGLRLDYLPGGFQGQSSVGVIEWDFDDALMDVDVPRTVGFGGDITVPPPYPFVGNGFVATQSGRLVPEYALAGTATPPNGAKLFELLDDGTKKILRAQYLNGSWVPQ